jgi:signal transduction histidine kinase
MEKILIVEDSKVFAETLRLKIKQKFNCDVYVAFSYNEACNILEHNKNFFVALLDMNLPDAPDGEIVDYVLQYDIPPVVFTGKFDDSLRTNFFHKNIVDYILKDNIHCIDYIITLLERLFKNTIIKVLVVDDSKLARTFLVNLLQNYKFQTIDAPDGQVALELLNEHKDIKLVITDYEMPVMDGFTFVKKLRQIYSKEELSIIGISGIEKPSLSAKFLKLGANDFLAKPFAEEEFYCRVIQNLETLEAIQQLKELNALKNKFLGIAAHDLRNPINAISGFSELLLLGMAGDITDEQKEYLSIIKKAADDMLPLVNDLLDASVIESGRLEIKRKRVSMKQLVENQVRLHELYAEQKKINILKQLEDVPEILVDPDRIAQVVSNLLSNAIKFSPHGKEIVVSLLQEDDSVLLKVKDNGPGITDEDKKKLFGEFQRLSATPTGGEKSTGLGLAIVKKIVDVHGGTITVNSVPGEGAEFVVSLPVN